MNAMRPHAPIRPFAALLGGLLVAACSGAPRAPDECASSMLPGDLVVTEFLANPNGTDSGNEWFELYNATDETLDLAGLTLISSQENGTNVEDHFVTGLEVPAGGYVVLGNSPNDEASLLPHVDYGYGSSLGDMRNEDARVAVACSDTVIDEAFYDTSTEGASRGFDGARTPEASANDDLAAWCDAVSVYDEDARGTPGEPNDACMGGAPTTCTEDGESRDVRAPAPGDLVISEFHANPAATAEGDGEWFEVFVGADIDLNGLEFGKTAGEADGSVASVECIPVSAGTYLVFAQSDDPGVNGGLESVAGIFDFALGNSASSLFIGRGGEVLDAISWTSTEDGAASNLDPDYFDTELNDDPALFCDATMPFGAGDLGSPGAANEECAIPPPPGMCSDGGNLVDIDPPAAGEIVITEFLANPEASEEADGEWIELAALGDFHLNGLELGRTVGEIDTTIEVEPCIPISAGEFVVVARSEDAATNGGLPVVHATFDFSLVNSDGSLFVGYGGEVLDEVTWASTTAAAATSLDPDATDPGANDDEASFCPATDVYGDGDLGTPGAENPQCGGSGTCNDGGEERPIVAPQIGDLVITEIMPDPSAVDDADGEWFEVLVTADVDLNGLQLGAPAGRADTTLPEGGDCLAVSAGDRIVLARSDDGATNGGLPAPFATFGFGITNSDGSVSVGHGGVTIDAVSWTDTDPGTALNLDPASEDPVANDDPLAFCAATMPYGDGDLGTPGAANTDCGGTTEGMCDDGGNLRAIVVPSAGDLVLTEVMANPAAVTDANGEWFEIAVLADVDLNGLELSTPGGLEQTLDAPECLEVTAGSFVLLAQSTDPLANGGLPEVDYVLTFGLTNSDFGLTIGVAGVSLDDITWTTTPTGASRSLDPASVDPTANDDDGNWCPGATVYGDGDLGTPGAANDSCA
jgi:hypothetical protein